MKDRILSCYSFFVSIMVTIGQLGLFNEMFCWDRDNPMISIFIVTIPMNFACIAMLTHERFKKFAVTILTVLGVNVYFLIWMNYLSYDYLSSKVINEMNVLTNDSILIGNSSFFRGEAILDCYREGSSEYHFRMTYQMFDKKNTENLKNYNESVAAEQIDDYLEEEIKSIYTKPLRFITSSLSMGTSDDFQLASPMKMIENISRLHLYCFIEEENLDERIIELGTFLKPYFWNTDCILILFSIEDVTEQIELFDRGFYHDPHVQLRLRSLE